jgi:hypothetical protein
MKLAATMPNRETQSLSQTTEAVREIQEQIRDRAYELYEQRGKVDGQDLEDWLRAESEVTQQEEKTVAA